MKNWKRTSSWWLEPLDIAFDLSDVMVDLDPGWPARVEGSRASA